MGRDLFDIHGRVVVLTGGLGRLGQAFTTALLDAGARVAILDQAASPVRVAARFGARAKSPRLMAVAADVTRRRSLEQALAKVSRRWGVPHALINNAAIDVPPGATAQEHGPVETYPERSWDRMMAVNVKGVLLCCQVFGGAMAKAGRGSVVNISSIYGEVAPDQRIYRSRSRAARFFKPAAYGVSKAGVVNLTKYLATYWAERNVRVNSLAFGGVFDHQDPAFLKAYAARVPLGRMAQPEEYAGAIVFLISDASSYMTGSNVAMDGGWTAW